MTDVVRLQLTPDQATRLALIAGDAARDGQNVLFIATASPRFSEGETVWELQALRVKASAAGRVKKAIITAAE